MINIDALIHEAAQSKSPALAVYRLVKAEFLRWVKDNPGKNFDEAIERKILKKMYDQRQDSLTQYTNAGRMDLAEIEAKEMEILKPFLPKETSFEEIEKLTLHIIVEDYKGQVTMKDTKSILAIVQAVYPDATGKSVSQIVKSYAS